MYTSIAERTSVFSIASASMCRSPIILHKPDRRNSLPLSFCKIWQYVRKTNVNILKSLEENRSQRLLTNCVRNFVPFAYIQSWFRFRYWQSPESSQNALFKLINEWKCQFKEEFLNQFHRCIVTFTFSDVIILSSLYCQQVNRKRWLFE